MAKVIAPLFSLAASGTLAGAITFVCGKSARRARLALKRSEEGPTSQNSLFAEAAAAWSSQTPQTKEQWSVFGKIVKDDRACIGLEYYLSGYQLFISYYMEFGVNGWADYPLPGPPPS